MGTLLASSLIAAARITLLDPSPGTTWSDATLLNMLNAGQRNAAELDASRYTLRQALDMVAGTLQTLPAGGTALIRLDSNVTSGRPVRLVDSAMLDAATTYWPGLAQTSEVREYCTDTKDPRRFRVNPPNDGTGHVIGLWSATPPPVAAVGNAITLEDTLELALIHFMLSEAYAANTKRQDLAKTTFYRQSYEKQLGINVQTKAAVAPKYGATPGGA